MHEDVWVIETSFTDIDKVKRALELTGVAVKEAGHDYKSKNPLPLSLEDQQAAALLIDAIADHEDVQEVYTNLAE
jgi:transcriptional/translational regulatory protein YebC/TACO1